jgi:hypothetical protein
MLIPLQLPQREIEDGIRQLQHPAKKGWERARQKQLTGKRVDEKGLTKPVLSESNISDFFKTHWSVTLVTLQLSLTFFDPTFRPHHGAVLAHQQHIFAHSSKFWFHPDTFHQHHFPSFCRLNILHQTHRIVAIPIGFLRGFGSISV